LQTLTIKDIAKALGVSTSTVSRALRDSHEINPLTKFKIIEYAKSINFIPNPMAISLRGKINKSIAIIVPTLHNSFFSEVIEGIDAVAHEKGYHITIFQTHESYEREIEEIHQALGRRVDGIAISLSGSTNNFDHLSNLVDAKFPIVFFDRVPDLPDTPKITIDNLTLAYECTQKIIDKGAKKIAHITTPLILKNIKERLDGFLKCLKDNKIDFENNLLKVCHFDPKEAEQAVIELLTNHEIDAIFTGSDRITVDVFRVLKNLFPEKQDKIIQFGFSNHNIVDLITPSIMVVKQPAFQLGTMTAQNLLHNIECKSYGSWKKEDVRIK
jgi:LacI family transcriptional regulator